MNYIDYLTGHWLELDLRMRMVCLLKFVCLFDQKIVTTFILFFISFHKFLNISGTIYKTKSQQRQMRNWPIIYDFIGIVHCLQNFLGTTTM